MGRTHVFSGMAVGALALPFAPVRTWPEALAWVVVAGGAAMLPDLDHPRATITRMWGPLSYVAHKVIYVAGRGHRGGSHDFVVAPLVFGLLTWLASMHPISAGVAMAIAIGIGVRAAEFVIPGRTAETAVVNLAISIGLAWVLVEASITLAWLPFAIGLGVLVHIGGDAVTKYGVPIPFSWLDGEPDGDGGPLTTGRWYEAWLIAPGLLVATVVGLYANVTPLNALVNGAVLQVVGLIAP